MAYNPKPVSLTTTAAKLTTAMGFSANKTIRQFDIILASGTATGYVGPSTVDNTGANAGAKFTTSIGYSIVPNPHPNTAVTSDDIWVVADASTTALVTVID